MVGCLRDEGTPQVGNPSFGRLVSARAWPSPPAAPLCPTALHCTHAIPYESERLPRPNRRRPFLVGARSAGLLRNAIPFLSLQGLKLLPQLTSDELHADGVTPVAKFGTEYAQLLQWAPRIKGRLRYITRQLLRPPLTLCHCDTHLENIFFHDRYPGGCAFIDFGNMRFQHALSDVAFFLATCLEPEVRLAHERALVERYHATLTAMGIQDYSLDLCWHDYRMQLWLAFVQAVTAAPDLVKQRKARTGMFAPPSELTKASKTLLEMYNSLNRRCAAALADHHWVGMVDDVSKSSFNYFGCSCSK